MAKIKPGVSVYNLGTGKGTSVLEMVAAFEKESGKKLNTQFAPRRPGDLAMVYANPAKAENELGWKTELTIEDAMKDKKKGNTPTWFNQDQTYEKASEEDIKELGDLLKDFN